MAFSYDFHLPVVLVGKFVFINTSVCVCVFIYQNKSLKMRVTKAISYAMKVFCGMQEVFWNTDPHQPFTTENWNLGNAAPELIQEFGPGNQNKSVELVSPIATFSLQTQLNIHWFATRGIIYSALCLLELVFVCLPHFREWVQEREIKS